MGTIVANFFTTVDGVVESPNTFIFPYFNEQVGAAVDAGTAGADAFLMGRQLYQEWSAYWPTSTDEPFASMINGMDKYVLSSTLSEPTWNRTSVLTGEDLVGQVRALKERVGTLAMSGSATTVRWLIANDLLDELHLLVAPLAVGSGARLFGGSRVPLTLVSSEALDTGVLHVVYAAAG